MPPRTRARNRDTEPGLRQPAETPKCNQPGLRHKVQGRTLHTFIHVKNSGTSLLVILLVLVVLLGALYLLPKGATKVPSSTRQAEKGKLRAERATFRVEKRNEKVSRKHEARAPNRSAVDTSTDCAVSATNV